jgi:hypothetical protein
MVGPHADLARPIKDGSSFFCSLFQNTEVFETRSYFSPLSDRQVDGSVPIFDRENWGHKVYYDATEMLLNRWLISLVCVPRGQGCVDVSFLLFF